MYSDLIKDTAQLLETLKQPELSETDKLRLSAKHWAKVSGKLGGSVKNPLKAHADQNKAFWLTSRGLELKERYRAARQGKPRPKAKTV